MKCTHCGNELSANAKFCGYCGKRIAVEPVARCPVCGAALLPRAEFCGHCGFGFTNKKKSGVKMGVERIVKELRTNRLLLISLVLVVCLIAGLAVFTARKTVVGTWRGTLVTASIKSDGTVSGNLFGGYYGYYVSHTSFNDSTITIDYCDSSDNVFCRRDIYEYCLEQNGDTLHVLSQTTIDYDSSGNEIYRHDPTINGWDWVLTRVN